MTAGGLAITLRLITLQVTGEGNGLELDKYIALYKNKWIWFEMRHISSIQTYKPDCIKQRSKAAG